MWEIWAIYLPPKTLKSCPKSHKLPHLVTLAQRRLHQIPMALLSQSNFKSFLFFSLEKAKTKLVLYLYHQFRLTAVIVRKLIKSSVCVIASHFLQHSVGKIHTHHRQVNQGPPLPNTIKQHGRQVHSLFNTINQHRQVNQGTLTQ